MPGVTKLATVTAATTGSTAASDVGGSMAAGRALYYAEVTAAAATSAVWTITANVASPAGTDIPIASTTVNADTTGVTAMTVDAAFLQTAALNSLPVPFPDNIVFTETSAGSSLTADVFVVWA